MTIAFGLLDGVVKWRIKMLFWIVLFCLVGSYSLYLSRLQPFPEQASRFAWILLVTALFLWITSTSPEASVDLPSVVSVVLEGFSLS